MRGMKLLFLALVVVVFGGGNAPVYAESARSLVEEGNRAFRNNKFEEALSAYEKAAVKEPESPRLYFNKAAALYMKGDFQKAADLFGQAAVKSKDAKLEARSRYNMGNSLFRESERQRDSDLQKSLAALQQSIVNYQQALQLDSSLADAAYNIEVARLTMKQVLDEIKKQQEQAKQQQERQQQAADQLKNLRQRQEKLAAATERLAQDKKQNSSANTFAEQLAKEQHDLTSDTGKTAEQIASDQNKSEPTAKKIKQHLQNSMAEQSIAEDKLKQQDLTEAHDAQKKSAAELKKAEEEMENKRRADMQQDQQTQPQQQGQPEQEQQTAAREQEAGREGKQQEGSEEEPQAVIQLDEDARDILNEEKENREQRQLAAPGGYSAIDKDW